MAFIVPSLNELGAKARAAFSSALGLVETIVWPNTHYVHAKVFALISKPVYLRIEYLYAQIFTSTADETHLENRHAYERGIRRKRASRATGSITTTGTANTTYPEGIRYVSGNLVYETTAAATADGAGALTFLVRSAERGSVANLDAGASLTLADASLYEGLGGTATVGPGGLGGGADKESVEALRARVLEARRKPKQGGAESDYAQFATDVAGVTKAWSTSFVNGTTTIGVWFLFQGRPNGIPTQADVDAVTAAIEARRMIRTGLAINAPTAVEVPMSIQLVPDEVSLRARVTDAIATMFEKRARPGLPNDDFVLPMAWISEAISDTVGEDRHRLMVPGDDLTFTAGQYPVPGAITWLPS